jgi:hypothetical protein
MTDSNCAYRKCAHVAVMHHEGAGSCTWPHCSCRQFVDPARMAIPARFDERYDPSPEPIVRRIS